MSYSFLLLWLHILSCLLCWFHFYRFSWFSSRCHFIFIALPGSFHFLCSFLVSVHCQFIGFQFETTKTESKTPTATTNSQSFTDQKDKTTSNINPKNEFKSYGIWHPHLCALTCTYPLSMPKWKPTWQWKHTVWFYDVRLNPIGPCRY